VDIPLRDTTYVLGANATGKSNLLDVFRFLRDISKPQGGGLQKAVSDRGGISKLRCLHARRPPEVVIDVELAESVDDALPAWRYRLAFHAEPKGARRTLIGNEKVWKGGSRRPILDRPNGEDRKDTARLTQTHLQQIDTNAEFRSIAEFFGDTTYLHVVPQLLKFGDQFSGHHLENDPFGQGLLEGMAKVPEKTRESRLKRIENALKLAIPRFEQLRFLRDKDNGRPHMEALYAHHRPHAGWQREDQFSDGTLRLIGLLWSLLAGNSLLLLEEPELSLNDAIVRQIPLMLQRLQRDGKRRRQIIVSSHSEALLSNEGIDGRGIIVLRSGPEGSTARPVTQTEADALKAGLSPAEVILANVAQKTAEKLASW
jgi:predicted ATPase